MRLAKSLVCFKQLASENVVMTHVVAFVAYLVFGSDMQSLQLTKITVFEACVF